MQMGRAAQFIAPDLSGVIGRAIKEYGWDAAAAADARTWYVNFLHVVWANPGGVNYIVGENADRLWHTHMTFSVRYTAYCMAVLGFYLNHTPILNPSPVTPEEAQACVDAYAAIGVGGVKTDSITPCW
jgi:hypothetical protein